MAFNNLQRLMCHKTKQTKPNQPIDDTHLQQLQLIIIIIIIIIITIRNKIENVGYVLIKTKQRMT